MRFGGSGRESGAQQGGEGLGNGQGQSNEERDTYQGEWEPKGVLGLVRQIDGQRGDGKPEWRGLCVCRGGGVSKEDAGYGQRLHNDSKGETEAHSFQRRSPHT